MDLAKYEALTGITVSEGDTTRVNAVINRSNALLESQLGYSLNPNKNLDIQERGKVQFGIQYPLYPIDVSTLTAPDEAEGTFRLFPYNESDLFLATDPFTNVYHVKLVQPINDEEFVTITDLNDFTLKRAKKFGKYIERQIGWFRWQWYSWLTENLGKDNGLMLAVDADWMSCNNCLPEDLQYLWADMVTYYSSDEVSVIGNIKSESVNGHSWSRSNAGGGNTSQSPEQTTVGAKTIALYAGPNGTSAARIPTV